MRTNCILLAVVLMLVEARMSLGYALLRLGGSRETNASNQRLGSNRDTEGSGTFEEEQHFHPRQLQYYYLSIVPKCKQVQGYVFSGSGTRCPRGWTGAPKCDQPDKRNLGSCRWKEEAEFGLPNTRANLSSALCKGKRMRCLEEAGVIPGNTQLLHAPRNSLSDDTELAAIMSHLRRIVAVNFARNDFEYLAEMTFQRNRRLRSVNFDQNFLLDLPQTLFSENKFLTSVSMMGNKLDYLPPWIFRWNPFLTIIDFERNNITKLAPELFRRNRRLEVIRLGGNLIPTIPEELLSRNPLLREVGLAHNRISFIPKMLFHNTRNLQAVFLSWNSIRIVPSHLFHSCLELRTIKLDRNMLTTLPPKLFERNLKLTHVDISYNRFHSVNPELFANNPAVAVVNQTWNDHEARLQEEDDEGIWHSGGPSQPRYRKTGLRPS